MCCPTLFHLKLYCDGFLWRNVSLSGVIFFFGIIGAIWCKFSTGPVCPAETGDILYSLGLRQTIILCLL